MKTHHIILLIVLITSTPLWGAEYTADPYNFHEIQGEAQSGDTILMAPGLYSGAFYEQGFLWAVIYPDGRNIIYKKDPNTSGEVILSGYRPFQFNPLIGDYWPPCQITNSEGNGCQLIGLTIYCSPRPEETISTEYKTGIVCNNSSPLIKDCNLVGWKDGYHGIDIFNANAKLVIQSCQMPDFNGAGIVLSYDVNVEINDCTISGVQTEYIGIGIGNYPASGTLQVNNSAISNFGGGGISVAGSEERVVNLDLMVNSCNIAGNGLVYGGNVYGGGIAWNSTDNTMLVSRCNLIGNAALDMGGGIYCTSSMARIEDCNITGNIAGNNGGGIECSGSSSAFIKNCKIENNYAYNAGGGVNGSTCLEHCIIRGNNTTWYGGGIKVYDSNIINCVINENKTSGDGGGVYLNGNAFCLYNCTIRNNEANGLGGGAYFEGGPVNVTNCIFWGNADTEDTPNYQRHHQIYSLYSYPFSINLRNCDIESTNTDANYVYDDNIIDDENNPDTNIIGNNLGGNINNDPNFTDDYHIGVGSQCINAGDNNAVYWTYDIDNQLRVMCAQVDIGADEVPYCGGIYFPDYNFDNFVNFLDFAIFANAWLTENPFISLDEDSDVDIYDLKIFCDYWLKYTNEL